MLQCLVCIRMQTKILNDDVEELFADMKLIFSQNVKSFFIVWLSILLVSACLPVTAFADVRNSDEIKGTSAESLGYTASVLPNISAEYAYVVDQDGQEYFARNAHEKTKIASVTKIMTAIVSLENSDESTRIEVSSGAASIGESSAMLQAGDVLSRDDALRALMICSGNDAAQALAENLGNGILDKMREEGRENLPSNGYDAFIQAMNDKAQELGMNDSRFGNPHGLDFDKYQGDFYSSAYDVSLMSRCAMQSDLFRSIVSTPKATITVTRNGVETPLELISTDLFLESYEGACGIKTGFTELAGSCFAGAAKRNDTITYAIILHASDEQQRFTDCKTLLNWVYDNTISYPLVHSTQTVSMTYNNQTQEVPVVAKVSNNSWIDETFDATLQNPSETVEIFALEGNVSQEAVFDDVQGDVRAGQKVGTLSFKQHNEVIAAADIIAAQDCAGPNFFEGVGIFWDRAIRSITGQPTQAASVLVNTTPLVSDMKAA